ncbi:protein disulfide isomerase-like 1-6 isoform X3 [Salvia splendens]|uniref:protein disulfide isomerase-like 1-6 isoform X3 n=1 Tax=Salvia splendens TaxID=180675 RepID=UPI001C27CEBC|nr:protein disulfide isomerase-like 1-6 isoform X3 [Salvia splendens]
MYNSKFSSRTLLLPSILLLLLTAAAVFSEIEDADDLGDIDELIAIDDEQENGENSHATAAHFESRESGKKTDVLSRAQRVVLELSGDTAKRAIEENEYVLVLGYAPWCGRSAELMPRFAEAANVLKGLGSRVLLAKIDGDRYSKAASSIEIRGFPTLLLFVNEIVLWTRKKTGAPVIEISSVADANEFLKQHSTYAVGLFDKFEEPDYGEFVKAAAADNEVQFIETSSTEVAKVLYPTPTKPFFGLVKSEPEHYTSFDGHFSSDEILHFLENNRFPLVTVMTELNSAKVYSSTNKLQVYVFAEDDDLQKLLKPLQEIAKKFKSQMMFVAVDIREENLAKPFLTLFGLEDSEDAVVVSFDYNSNSKYLLESDITSRNIEELQEFCTGLVQGTLKPYYKSQTIPDNKNASVLTVVGKTFDELVINNPANIVLEVHTPWCITCEATTKHVEKMAKHFKGLDNLVFARIDASTNEHPKLQVEDYPTLLFYPANDKSNPIKLSTKSNMKDLAALINKILKTQDGATKDEL